jgi:uncharacterized protein (DUF885 family)
VLRIALLFALAAALPAQAHPGPKDFDRWADAVARADLRADPNAATSTQMLAPAEQARLDAQLTPDGPADRERRLALARRALHELAGFDRAGLSAQQRASAALLEWSFQQRLANAQFERDAYVFDQLNGLHLVLVDFLTHTHPLRNSADVDHYLARLAQVAARIDEGVARARSAQEQGVLMPRFITEESIAQLNEFLAPGVAGNVFVTSLAERMEGVQSLKPARRSAALARARILVDRSVIPAYRRVLALLQAQLPLAPAEGGLGRLPGGDAAYAQALRNHTTTELTARQIHELGLAEVARIEAEMDALFRQLGYAEGSIDARFSQLEADSQPKEADPRPALLARFRALEADALKRSAELFEISPKAPLVVMREPALSEAEASPHYDSAARDGSRPGMVFITLPGPKFEITGMRTLAYHEGIPGHHFQGTIQQETRSLPLFRSLGVYGAGSAFVEGWALYAEHLAVEAGWYEGDPRGHIGQLNDELLRARRLVVDTGLHAMNWTRQQALDYGAPAQEVDRYIVWPGQACAYKIGMLRIQAMRERARAALGERFSLKKFHTLLLQTGDVPLAVMDQVVDGWIAEQVGTTAR